MATRSPAAASRRRSRPSSCTPTLSRNQPDRRGLHADHGRVAMVARGAKRPRSELRGLLQAFQPLLLSWYGQARAQDAAAGGVAGRPAAAARLGAAVRLLSQRAAAEAPGRARIRTRSSSPTYEAGARRSWPAAREQATLLRRFELALLAELGYALPLVREADTGAPLDPAARLPLRVRSRPAARGGGCRAARAPLVRGATLLALADGRYPDAETAARGQAPDARGARPSPRAARRSRAGASCWTCRRWRRWRAARSNDTEQR